MATYDHEKIEKKWQKRWKEGGLYRTKEDSGKKKCYVLDMFPYPSGEGLHVGHPKGYIATDVYSRMKRMQGMNILHPMGWDAFGLPAEQYALKNKVHPRAAVEKNVARFKEQLEKIGFNYDWEREVSTTDPQFYRWTQWIFKQLWKSGLAYESHEPINWCPSCKTGLSNEDLEAGKCERCGTVVEKKALRQWVLAITKYADRMLEDLDLLSEWPESIKESQRNWIGRSEGAEITFPLHSIPGQEDGKHSVTVFTTRPDTLFGATYIAISAELAKTWMDAGWTASEEVRTFVEKTLADETTREYGVIPEKEGIATGIMAKNPANGEMLPVWVANYVLSGYGSGAIMAVPAHDERDGDFARKFNLPIKVVVKDAKNFENVSQARNLELLRDIARLSSEREFTHLLVGGLATTIRESIADARNTDVDVYVDAKGFSILKEHFIKLKFKIEDKKDTYGWQNAVSYFLDTGEWVDVFLMEESNGALKDNVADSEFRLCSLTETEIREIDGVNVRIPNTEAHRRIYQHLATTTTKVCFTGAGMLVDSSAFDGMPSEKAKWAITEKVGGKSTVTYRLKDWVFARQRYWGEPFPIVFDENHKAYAVADTELPVLLPDVESYEPTGTGESPLANIPEWVEVWGHLNADGEFESLGKDDPKAKRFTRETNTMPQWAGSSWYYLRFIDPKNSAALVAKDKEKYWGPVDVYVGGAEHATRHLIYARFWHKFLFDNGLVSSKEPFLRLHNVGLIQASDGRKMSKRYGNVVNPDDIVGRFGADSLRVYEMFMGPFSQAIAWSTENMMGVRRFIERVWRASENVREEYATSADTETLLHLSVKKVGEDIERFAFNTAISQMMILLNALEKDEAISVRDWAMFLRLLAPFAPHVAEELWEKLGEKNSVHESAWPEYAEAKTLKRTVSIAVQINGKVRATLTVDVDTDKSDVIKEARGVPDVAKYLNGKSVTQEVYVPGRIVNFVVS